MVATSAGMVTKFGAAMLVVGMTGCYLSHGRGDDAGLPPPPPVDAGTDAAIVEPQPCAARPWMRPDRTLQGGRYVGGVCAIQAGRVYCWGVSPMAHVDGYEPVSPSPRRIEGIEEAVEIDTNTTHGCALLDGGRVACWGLNEHGQLGDGTLDSRLDARVVDALPPVTQLVVAANASCALDLDGRVWCWGLNLYAAGACAEADLLDPCPRPGIPDTLPRPVVRLVSGWDHFCALDTRGTVVCWGSNFGWAFAREEPPQSARPLPIPLPDGAVDVTARTMRTCARLESCEVHCWGLASWPAEVDTEDGRGLVPPARLSVYGDREAGPALESSARWLEPGLGTACVLQVEGHPVCWGINASGELGNGRLEGFETLTEIPLDLTEIVPMNGLTCGRDRAGTVWCWGGASTGGMGDGYPRARPRPTRVETLTATRALVTAPWAYGFAAVTEGGAVVAWGVPFPLDPFNPRSVDLEESARRSHPTAWPFLGGARLLALGFDHGCVATSGSVECFGENDSGQLGVIGPAPEPDETVTAVSGSIVAIDAADGHACAIREGGQLLCWGDSSHGQLGRFPGTSAPGPTAPVIDDAVQVATTQHLTCVVRESGRVTCFGENSWGGLGRGYLPEPGDDTFEWRPRSTLEIDDAVAIDAHPSRVCAVRASGSLHCWGSNQDGLLSAGTSEDFVHTPTAIPGITDAARVSVGAFHVCFVTRGGSVGCWGQNDFGQLGDGTYVSRARPEIVEGLDEVEEVRVSQAATCARRADGSVWCWGRDIDGELGLGSELVVTTPRRVPLPE